MYLIAYYLCKMIVYIIRKDSEIAAKCFTSLQSCCKFAGVSYSSAVQGKRTWKKQAVEIAECEVIRMKRGNKSNFLH